MEFLDINSSLLLNAIHSLFYWRILKKTILYSGFKNLYEKIRETRKLRPMMNSILQNEKMSLRKLEFIPRNLD
jgi:hypothetical protein